MNIKSVQDWKITINFLNIFLNCEAKPNNNELVYICNQKEKRAWIIKKKKLKMFHILN